MIEFLLFIHYTIHIHSVSYNMKFYSWIFVDWLQLLLNNTNKLCKMSTVWVNDSSFYSILPLLLSMKILRDSRYLSCHFGDWQNRFQQIIIILFMFRCLFDILFRLWFVLSYKKHLHSTISLQYSIRNWFKGWANMSLNLRWKKNFMKLNWFPDLMKL